MIRFLFGIFIGIIILILCFIFVIAKWDKEDADNIKKFNSDFNDDFRARNSTYTREIEI